MWLVWHNYASTHRDSHFTLYIKKHCISYTIYLYFTISKHRSLLLLFHSIIRRLIPIVYGQLKYKTSLAEERHLFFTWHGIGASGIRQGCIYYFARLPNRAPNMAIYFLIVSTVQPILRRPPPKIARATKERLFVLHTADTQLQEILNARLPDYPIPCLVNKRCRFWYYELPIAVIYVLILWNIDI